MIRNDSPRNGSTPSMEQVLNDVGFEWRDDPQLESILRHLHTITAYADERVRILLNGPTGTGKELLAKAIHRFVGGHDEQFFDINCSTLDPNGAGSTLFGVAPKAYTGVGPREGMFHRARKPESTLFLDEIHQLQHAVRPQLYRVLNEGTFHVMGDITQEHDFDGHVVAAASSNLDDMRNDGTFPQDLYSRLADTDEIRIPSFDERTREHKLRLVHYGFAHWPKKPVEYDSAIAERLIDISYPGNVRDLRALMKQIMAYARRDAEHGIPKVTEKIMDEVLKQPRWQPGDSVVAESPERPFIQISVPTDGMPWSDHQKEIAEQALSKMDGNKKLAARALGVTRGTLDRWLKHGEESLNGSDG